MTLPKKDTTLKLGESRSRALVRFQRNEASLLRKGTWTKFQAVVQEYLDLGHAQLVTQQELDTPLQVSYYLPMHGVHKESSSTTKLRVVFDGSAPSSTDVSLNDLLAVGPTLHPILDSILLKFRTYRVALTGDISKMYWEVMLSPPDRQLHRFLWRPQPDQPVLDYCMNRVTFGVASSPYLAVRTLQQTATNFCKEASSASWHVTQSFDVDDLLAGADTVAQAVELFRDLREMLSKGGFDLKKWRSNSSEVLKAIPPDLQELVPTQDLVDLHSAQYPKALGVTWDSNKDNMSTHVQLPCAFVSTKCGVISDVARTFDVLGWIAPVSLQIKVVFQQLWQLKIGWDEELPMHCKLKHEKWREELPLLQTIEFPRCYYSMEQAVTIQLHGFCDASEAAYAAVVYVRATYPSSLTTCKLVIAKTRVAPLKKLTIPRLELCGAALLVELLDTSREALDIPLEDTHAWCDSTIVLAWLKNSPSKYKTFVANRVATVASLLPTSAWKHVPTLDNPADCASRGMSA